MLLVLLVLGLVLGLVLVAHPPVHASADTSLLLSQSNLQLHGMQSRHGLNSWAGLKTLDVRKTTKTGIKTSLPGQSYAQVRSLDRCRPLELGPSRKPSSCPQRQHPAGGAPPTPS